MIPLNPRDSAIPGVVFTFSVKNPGTEKVMASLAASLENGVGYDGHGRIDGVKFHDFCGNVNTVEKRDRLTAIAVKATVGRLGRFDKYLRVLTTRTPASYMLKVCENTRLDMLDWRRKPTLRLPSSNDIAKNFNLIWMSDLPGNIEIEPSAIENLCEGVRRGGNLLITGQGRTLFTILAQSTKAQELLPITCDGAEKGNKEVEVLCDGGSPLFKNVTAEKLRMRGSLAAKNARLKGDAKVILKSPAGDPLVMEGAFGKGRVVLSLAPMENCTTGVDQKTLIANLVAYAAGTSYSPPTGVPETSPTFGSMALGTLAENPSCLPQWDDPEKFWGEFSTSGTFASAGRQGPSRLGSTWNGAIAVPLELSPGEEKTVTFFITWHFPNHYRDFWEPAFTVNLGNMYCSWFKDALEAANYLGDNFDRLSGQTRLYHDTLYDTTLPRWVMDLVSSQSSIIRTQTLMWLAGDIVAGYEGCGGDAGCCPMNCTHVYNYEQSLAHLFPSLERNMRTIDLTVQLDPATGMVHHRTALPLTAPRSSGEAIDGQLGTILKAYREHLHSSDRSFLDSVWPGLKKAMNFVMVNHDPDSDGVIEDRQFNTYDCAVHGPNTFIGSLYLAALRAMEEMAKVEGQPELAKQYRKRYKNGRARLAKQLWNGEYFIQKYDEKLHPEFEYGTGCFSDQLLGQWWAHVDNMGYVLPEDKVKSAMKSIFRYNWMTDFTEFKHSQRVFADGEDKGLLVCSWPKGGRPERPILYCDEVWTGIEYQVAATMIWNGLIEEAFQVARGARDRYNGIKRNPWNDIECGGHYARAMSSWSVLLALEGSVYDGPRGALGFAPRCTPDDFRAFFSTAEGWGTFTQKRVPGEKGLFAPAYREQTDTIELRYGRLALKELSFALPEKSGRPKGVRIVAAGTPVRSSFKTNGKEVRITLAEPTALIEGQKIEAAIAW
jgi:uncharacterized protein (DUF608 family)